MVGLLSKKFKFPKSEIVVVDPKNLPPLPSQCWLKPKKHNQGGYDAVYIDKVKGLVHFVQVTKSDTHSFLMGYFYVMIESLVKREMSEVKKMEIFFVIESQNAPAFKFSTVTGQGLLKAFGWEKDKEIEKLRLVTVDGVDSWDALRW
ncbi:Crinkler [Phytophthora palmivora]|uniref:Crinkler n=1 Tax=Phytophthora palmivora TaxID=4796 RepID=A0A2P4YDQ0_9STRA|nr:Crinkler [Phytophthora palmivora]